MANDNQRLMNKCINNTNNEAIITIVTTIIVNCATAAMFSDNFSCQMIIAN